MYCCIYEFLAKTKSLANWKRTKKEKEAEDECEEEVGDTKRTGRGEENEPFRGGVGNLFFFFAASGTANRLGFMFEHTNELLV